MRSRVRNRSKKLEESLSLYCDADICCTQILWRPPPPTTSTQTIAWTAQEERLPRRRTRRPNRCRPRRCCRRRRRRTSFPRCISRFSNSGRLRERSQFRQWNYGMRRRDATLAILHVKRCVRLVGRGRPIAFEKMLSSVACHFIAKIYSVGSVIM